MERLIRFDGVVAEILPGGKYRVCFPNGHQVTADALMPDSDPPGVGDAITVEISPYGAGVARLFFRRFTH